jgi:hypothetical protein
VDAGNAWAAEKPKPTARTAAPIVDRTMLFIATSYLIAYRHPNLRPDKLNAR